MPLPDDPNRHDLPDKPKSAGTAASDSDPNRNQARPNPNDMPTQAAGLRSAGSEVASDFDSALDLRPSVFRPGEVVAERFRIVRYLARGGMGELYEAEDLELRDRVALKTILPKIAVDERLVSMFKREVYLARQVTHPNVCRIFDVYRHKPRVGTAAGQDALLLAMELLHGENLADRLRRDGRLSTSEVLPLVRQMAAGLEAAHRVGVVHRDFKSHNVMLVKPSSPGQETRAVITDFGLARRSSQEERTSLSMNDANEISGTPAYMAPEQVEGGPITPATDIYALGVVMYEMVAGMWPFVGDTPLQTAIKRLQHPAPTPRIHLPDLDERWEAAILRCLERDPANRFASTSEVVAALEGERKEPRAAAQGQRGKWIALGLAAMVLVLAVALGVSVFRSRPAKPVETAQAPLTVRPLASLPGRKQFPIFSSDGNAVVFAWDGGHEGQNSDVYIMQLEGGKPLQVTNHPASEWPQCFSPDGRRLYFNRQSESGFASYWVPALGGEETRVADGIVTDIAPDGRSAAVVRLSGSGTEQRGIFVLDLASGAERRVAEDFGTMSPKFSSDGQWLFVPNGPNRDRLSLHRVPIAGGPLEAVRFPNLGDDIDRIEAIELSQRRTRMRIAARTKVTNAAASFIANADGSEPKRLPASIAPGALSPDGRQMVSARTAFVVTLYRVETFPARGRPVSPEKVLETQYEEYSPSLSPDSSRILLSSLRKGRWEIWLWNAAMTDGRPIFSREGGTAGSPTWSPDGKWIAFDARTKNAAGDIWLMAASGEPKLLVEDPADDITPCFDPSSQWVYFTSSRTGSLQLFQVPVAGGPVTQVTQGGGFTCQFSQDGRYIYYLKTRNGGEIWRLEVATNREEPVVPEMKSRNWKVLRDGIYMLDSRTNSQLGTAARVGDARFYRFATKKVKDLGFRTPKASAFIGIDVSPDGKWLYYSQVDSSMSDVYVVENLP